MTLKIDGPKNPSFLGKNIPARIAERTLKALTQPCSGFARFQAQFCRHKIYSAFDLGIADFIEADESTGLDLISGSLIFFTPERAKKTTDCATEKSNSTQRSCNYHLKQQTPGAWINIS